MIRQPPVEVLSLLIEGLPLPLEGLPEPVEGIPQPVKGIPLPVEVLPLESLPMSVDAVRLLFREPAVEIRDAEKTICI